MGAWIQIGSLAPLFDRLVDHDLHQATESPPLINYDKDQLLNSLRRETSRLFNTRCPLSYKEYMARKPFTLTYGDPLLYGLPSFIFLNPQSAKGKDLLTRVLYTAVRLFENRLSSINIALEPFSSLTQDIPLTIQGLVILDEVLVPVQFPAALSPSAVA